MRPSTKLGTVIDDLPTRSQLRDLVREVLSKAVLASRGMPVTAHAHQGRPSTFWCSSDNHDLQAVCGAVQLSIRIGGVPRLRFALWKAGRSKNFAMGFAVGFAVNSPKSPKTSSKTAFTFADCLRKRTCVFPGTSVGALGTSYRAVASWKIPSSERCPEPAECLRQRPMS